VLKSCSKIKNYINSCSLSNFVRTIENIEIPKGNKFIIQIYLNNLSGSKTFLSEETFQNEFNLMKRRVKTSNNGQEIKLKLIDTITKQTKEFVINFKIDKDNKKTIENLKDKLVYSNNNKYRVVIDNMQTSQLDKRALVIKYPGDILNCTTKTKELLENIIKEQNDTDIIFSNDDKKAHTHRIFIQKCGSTEDYKNMICKSFSIKLNNYSSIEIVNLMKKKLQKV